MSCTGCTSKFSFLNKESSCNLCQFSFCSKCLKKKSIHGNLVRNVCDRCYVKKDGGSEIDIEPPALLLKRLELLENPARPPVTIFQANERLDSLKRGLSVEDKKLVERLEKLKEDKTKPCVVPSDLEIKERLQALKGVTTESEAKQSPKTVPPITSQEQVDNLLMEYLEQITLERDYKDKDLQSNSKLSDTDSEDEGKAAAKLVTRVMEEAALPDCDVDEVGLSPPKFSPIEWEPAESELPWCEMCNGNARIRCIGCDGALYCQRCFNQGHDYFELKSHKTIPFNSESTSN